MSVTFDPALDFVCVGVGKSGTTSLHYALRSHPDVVLPWGKEAPFFLRPDKELTPEAWARFAKERFSQKSGVKGKITPQYWYDPHMPEKLVRAFGDRLKILVLFRHPVDMVISMYRMQVRRGKIAQPFEQFLEEGLAWLEQARERHDEGIPVSAEILASGEYARVLRKYVETFGWENVYVAFFEEMIRTPQTVLAEIQKHIGVRPLPLSLPHANRGDVAPAVGWVSRMLVRIEQGMRRFPRLRALFRNLTGPWRHELIAWAYLRQVVRKPDVQNIHPEYRRALEKLYADEINALREMLGRPLPWDFRNHPEQNT